ncbi:hypothetical protein K3495_g4986 [Podosphaera aphanis]|nr:hypothetical protein K3495_g4986 [Podosphaera aphanis]
MTLSEQRADVPSMVGSPSARFTAVNSASDSSQNSNRAIVGNGSMMAQVQKLDEKANGQPPKTAQSTQEKLTIDTTSSSQNDLHEDWPSSVNAKKMTYPQLKNSDLNVNEDPSSNTSHKPDTEEVLIRKRSNSTGQSLFHSYPLPPPTSSKFIPNTSIADSDIAQEENLRQQLQACSRETYTPSGAQFGQFRQSINPHEEHESAQDSEKWVIGEVLHRVPHSLDAHIRQQTSFSASSTGQDSVGPFSQVQGEAKRRKRNFSNRTKTGCMTCRKRKKKCDETKPHCNNCQRGGFTCSGYQVRGQCPKPESKQSPVPLQSKTEFELSPHSSKISYPPLNSAGPHRTEPPTTYRGQPFRIEQQQNRPIDVDDDRLTAPILTNNVCRISPDNHHPPYSLQSSSPAGHQYVQQMSSPASNTYAQQTPSPVMAAGSGYPDCHPKDRFKRIRLETPRSEHQISLPHPMTQNQTPMSNHAQGSEESLPSNALCAQKAAQLALSNLASSSYSPSSYPPKDVTLAGPPTHKEDMLAGRHFSPFDKQLARERESCSGACWRFNNSANPNVPVSPEERARLFRDILQAYEHVISPTQASPVNPVGRIGDNVIVDTPFYCDYGYNINIGQDVVINKNCTILDTCEVHIGDRCYLGPNVNIYTTMLPIDPKRRLGSKGPHLGRKVIIESDCWIGGSVVILPGRKIGKGATIGAGSVVTKDIPPYTVAGGNPACILRKVEHYDVVSCGNLSHIPREDDDDKTITGDDSAHSIREAKRDE